MSEDTYAKLERANKLLADDAFGAAASVYQALLKERDSFTPEKEYQLQGGLSECHRRLKDNRDAIKYGTRAAALAHQLFSEFSEEHARWRHRLGDLYAAVGEYHQAKKEANKGQSILKKLGISDSELYGAILCVYAKIEMEQEHYKEALVEFEKAQEVLLKHSEGIEYASMLAKMGTCFERSNDNEKALRYTREAVDAVVKIHGADHVDAASALRKLGKLHLRLKQYDEAIPFLEQSLKIRRALLGDKHHDTQEVLQEILDAKKAIIEERGPKFPCTLCGKMWTSLWQCTRCRSAVYCDGRCQRSHWPTHKTECVPPPKKETKEATVTK